MNAILNDTRIEYLSLSRPLIREPHLLRRWQSGDMIYAVQFEADSLAALNRWRTRVEPPLMQDLSITFLSAVSAFSTIMAQEDLDGNPAV